MSSLKQVLKALFNFTPFSKKDVMLSLKQVLKAFFNFTPLNISSQNFEDLEPYIPDDMSSYDQIFEREKGNPQKGEDVYSFIMDKYHIESEEIEEDIAYFTDQLNRILTNLHILCEIVKQTQIPDEIEGEIALIYSNLYFQELYHLLNFLEEEK